jgi:hypothetical protein
MESYLHHPLPLAVVKRRKLSKLVAKQRSGPDRLFSLQEFERVCGLLFSFSTKTTNSNHRQPVIFSTWLATPMRVSRLILPHF